MSDARTLAETNSRKTNGESSSSSDEMTMASRGDFLWSLTSSVEEDSLTVDVMLYNAQSVPNTKPPSFKAGTYDHALRWGRARSLLTYFRPQGDQVGVQARVGKFASTARQL